MTDFYFKKLMLTDEIKKNKCNKIKNKKRHRAT